MMQKIAIIGANGQTARNYAIKARELGIETYMFAWNKGADAKEEADYFYDVSIFEEEKIIAVCRDVGISGVIATTEATIAVAGHIANALGFNGNPIHLSDHITDKYWVRQRCTKIENAIKQPAYFAAADRNDVFSGIKKMQFPIVIKPITGGGKIGVTMIENETQLDEALSYAFSNDRGKGILVEEFINGKEYSVETLSFHGEHTVIQITDKISSGPPHCVELGHSQPADISDTLWMRIIDSVKTLFDAIGFENGPLHTEIKINNEGIYLIEVNGRPGGDFISYPLIDLSTGYDYLGEAIKISLNEKPAKFRRMILNYAGVRFVTNHTPQLKAVLDEIETKPWIYQYHVNHDFKEFVTNTEEKSYFIYCSKESITI